MSTRYELSGQWIIGIDPGPNESGIVRGRFNGQAAEHGGSPPACLIGQRALLAEISGYFDSNESLLDYPLPQWCQHSLLAIEWPATYGMAVGQSIFQTCFWAGRFVQRWFQLGGPIVVPILRSTVRNLLAGHVRATGQELRNAIYEMYGGDRKAAHGTKKNPGPLYGISGHCMDALAVALALAKMIQEGILEQQTLIIGQRCRSEQGLDQGQPRP